MCAKHLQRAFACAASAQHFLDKQHNSAAAQEARAVVDDTQQSRTTPRRTPSRAWTKGGATVDDSDRKSSGAPVCVVWHVGNKSGPSVSTFGSGPFRACVRAPGRAGSSASQVRAVSVKMRSYDKNVGTRYYCIADKEVRFRCKVRSTVLPTRIGLCEAPSVRRGRRVKSTTSLVGPDP